MNVVLLKPISGAEMQQAKRKDYKPRVIWRRGKISGAFDYETDWRIDLSKRLVHNLNGQSFTVGNNPDGEQAIGVAPGSKPAGFGEMLNALMAWRAAQTDELRRGAQRAEEAPARLHDALIVEIKYEPRKGSYRRFKNTKEHVLISYKENGQLSQAEYDAGEAYTADFKCVFESSKDSLDFGVGGRASSFAPVSQAQADAIKRMIAIDSRLSQSNRKIVRLVCGEGHWASYAVRHVTKEDSKPFAMPRFREAMRCLVSASAKARAEGWTVWMGVPVEPGE